MSCTGHCNPVGHMSESCQTQGLGSTTSPHNSSVSTWHLPSLEHLLLSWAPRLTATQLPKAAQHPLVTADLSPYGSLHWCLHIQVHLAPGHPPLIVLDVSVPVYTQGSFLEGLRAPYKRARDRTRFSHLHGQCPPCCAMARTFLVTFSNFWVMRTNPQDSKLLPHVMP